MQLLIEYYHKSAGSINNNNASQQIKDDITVTRNVWDFQDLGINTVNKSCLMSKTIQ